MQDPLPIGRYDSASPEARSKAHILQAESAQIPLPASPTPSQMTLPPSRPDTVLSLAPDWPLSVRSVSPGPVHARQPRTPSPHKRVFAQPSTSDHVFPLPLPSATIRGRKTPDRTFRGPVVAWASYRRFPDSDHEVSRPTSRCGTVRSRRSVVSRREEEEPVPTVPRIPSVYGHQIRESARPGSVLSHDDVDVYSIGVAEALSVHHISNASMKAHSVAGSIHHNSSIHADDDGLGNEELGIRTIPSLPLPTGVRRVSEASHASRRSRFMERFSVEGLCEVPREREEFGSAVHVERVEVEEDGDRDVVEGKIEEEGYEVLGSDDEEHRKKKGWMGSLKRGAKLLVCCKGKTG